MAAIWRHTFRRLIPFQCCLRNRKQNSPPVCSKKTTLRPPVNWCSLISGLWFTSGSFLCRLRSAGLWFTADLIQEGNVGLMKAVRRYNPEFKVRLVSFAVHWIKAEMHEFILKNWRIVKIATTKAQRKLFFNLRGSKKRLGWMNEQEVHDIAHELGVEPHTVRQMEGRLASRDQSFDLPENDDEESISPVQYLEDSSHDPGELVEAEDSLDHDHKRLMNAFGDLDGRAREIITARWLSEKKLTLHQLADRFGISAERVRQLEQNALKKLRGKLGSL